MKKILKITVILLGYLTLPSPVLANTPETFGMGSRASAMGNAYTSVATGPFAFYYNPPSSFFSPGVEIGFGSLVGIPRLAPIKNPVVLETAETGDAKSVGQVDVNYDSTIGAVFGLSLPLRKTYPRVGFGLTGYLPFDRFMSVHFEQPYLPTYPMYSNRTQRFSFYSGAAVEVYPNVSVGGGVNVFTKMKGQTVLRASSSVPMAVLGVDVTPGISPVAGIQYQTEKFGAGLTYRHEAKSTAKVAISPQLNNVMGANLGMDLLTAGTFFYDPSQFAAGVFYRVFDQLTIATDFVWARWSNFELPYFDVDAKTPDLGETRIRGQFHNTLSPKVGLEYQLELLGDRLALRAGYQFQPTPINDQQPKNLNLLDADKHIYSAGIGYGLDSFFGVIETPVEIDLHAQLHQLKSREFIKASEEVGGPGYDVGGSLYSFGLSLTSHF